MKALLITLLFAQLVVRSGAQVTNTSYTTPNGEKALQFSVIVPGSIEETWKLFTTDEGLKKWIAPVVKIDMKTGGSILTNYNVNKSADDSTSIKLGIINYIDQKMITLKVNLNKNFPAKAVQEDKNLQEIILFEKFGDSRTRIISTMVGWGNGDHWDKTYTFFEKGNEWTYKEFLKLFK
jgi:hypothetical protein